MNPEDPIDRSETDDQDDEVRHPTSQDEARRADLIARVREQNRQAIDRIRLAD